jgi:hypothetical protein
MVERLVDVSYTTRDLRRAERIVVAATVLKGFRGDVAELTRVLERCMHWMCRGEAVEDLLYASNQGRDAVYWEVVSDAWNKGPYSPRVHLGRAPR